MPHVAEFPCHQGIQSVLGSVWNLIFFFLYYCLMVLPWSYYLPYIYANQHSAKNSRSHSRIPTLSFCSYLSPIHHSEDFSYISHKLWIYLNNNNNKKLWNLAVCKSLFYTIFVSLLFHHGWKWELFNRSLHEIITSWVLHEVIHLKSWLLGLVYKRGSATTNSPLISICSLYSMLYILKIRSYVI